MEYSSESVEIPSMVVASARLNKDFTNRDDIKCAMRVHMFRVQGHCNAIRIFRRRPLGKCTKCIKNKPCTVTNKTTMK